jgi:hypothetical protein
LRIARRTPRIGLAALIIEPLCNTMVDMSSGYIAIDLGAESGRVVVGVLEGGRLRLEEIHRFAH